jgi:hypothetical protein
MISAAYVAAAKRYPSFRSLKSKRSAPTRARAALGVVASAALERKTPHEMGSGGAETYAVVVVDRKVRVISAFCKAHPIAFHTSVMERHNATVSIQPIF